ncbi:hypothetical protein FOCC_FOCC003426 [Frankliniella occidentalis]|nr:hypothetical protein FOCC_FOCC003426 [Frankliniella occidentalis]
MDTMETLLDDTLLSVLQYVGNKDLLHCRVVCRRWRDLITHPDIWKCRSIGGGLLRLNPPSCRELSLKSWELRWFGFLASTTSTPAPCLSLHPDSDLQAVLCAVIIRHHASLGRLKKIAILDGDIFSDECLMTSAGLSELLCSIRSVEGLTCLHISIDIKRVKFDPAARSYLDFPPPSLRKLAYYSKKKALLEVLLQMYASSLREVQLYDELIITKKLAHLLVKVEHLETLQCRLFNGMELLLSSRTLKSILLHVWLEEEISPAHSSAMSFLRSATHLKRVQLDFYFDWNPDAWVIGLVKALAESGRSKVSSFVIDMRDDADFSSKDIGGCLPNLPYLQTLELLSSVSSSVLCAIQPHTAPKLTELIVWEVQGCPSCNWSKVCDMLLLNPHLKFTVKSTKRKPSCDSCKTVGREGFPKTVFRMSSQNVHKRL